MKFGWLGATLFSIAGCVPTAGEPAPDFVAEQDDSPPSDRIAPDAELPNECGIRPGSTYRGCWLEYDVDSISTLCDEDEQRCVRPVPECADGWCMVPARSFQGGATDEADWRKVESEPRSIMLVPRKFLMSETEVTFADFESLMGYLPDTDLRCGGDCPVAGVSVFEAMLYTNAKSAQAGLPPCYVLEECGERHEEWLGFQTKVVACSKSIFLGPECRGFRLPSGREYELAARAGSPFCLSRGRLDRMPVFGDCGPRDPKAWPHRLATFCGNSGATDGGCPMLCEVTDDDGDRRCAAIPFVSATDGHVCLSPQPVRSRLPNPFGFYGLHGNVAEWTQSGRSWVLNDLLGEASSAENLEVADTPEFEYVVDESTHLLTSGAGYWQTLSASCGNNLQLTHENLAKIARHQLVGFRIVRTLD